MKKRVLASVMAATMAAASLAGCGGSKPAETTAAPATEAAPRQQQKRPRLRKQNRQQTAN